MIGVHEGRRIPSLYERTFTNSWGLEFLGWLSATIMPVILLVILAIFDGKSLSQWHSQLTLNTIIAVLTQIAQMTLIVPITESISQIGWLWVTKKRPLTDLQAFDEASRGPLSSIFLLWKRHENVLVYLAAISMTLQVLFGPFAQQALQLPTRRIGSGNGTIAKSVQYWYPRRVSSVDSEFSMSFPKTLPLY